MKVTAEGKSASWLNFTALHMEHEEETHKENADLLAKKSVTMIQTSGNFYHKQWKRSLTRKIRKPDFLRDKRR
jgi:hypothetical protein